MSTIHDALQKVQDDMDTQQTDATGPAQPRPPHNPFNKPPQSPPPAETVKAGTPKPPQKNFWGVILVIILVCGVGFAGTYFIDRMDILQIPKIELPFTQPKHAQVKAEDDEVLRIKGIMTTKGKNVALIHNGIYEKGDIVDGMTIIEISPTQVTLTNSQGEQTVLGISK